MNFFEQELRKLMEKSVILKDQKYVGRLCYGAVDGDIRARIEFVETEVNKHYDGIKASIINRKERVVDSMLFRFSDIWGKKKVDNPNFRDGVMPYIWTNNGKSDWYVFHPKEEDYRQLSTALERYLSVFVDMDMEVGHDEGMQQMI